MKEIEKKLAYLLGVGDMRSCADRALEKLQSERKQSRDQENA